MWAARFISWSSLENRQLDGAAHPSASRIALGRITALGVWHKETSTDRRLFEANRGLTHQEAASSINYNTEGLGYVANNQKRGLTRGGIIEVLATLLRGDARFNLKGFDLYSISGKPGSFGYWQT